MIRESYTSRAHWRLRDEIRETISSPIVRGEIERLLDTLETAVRLDVCERCGLPEIADLHTSPFDLQLHHDTPGFHMFVRKPSSRKLLTNR